MSFEACAAIVEKGDPDRFLAVMAAPVAVRRILFAIYAFNVEVARAPWVTQEPMIAEMRLQWWRDALEEIASGGPVRKHEVTTALADVLDPESARVLDGLVAARRWDVYKDPFEEHHHFEEYINATSGDLLWTAVRLVMIDKGLPIDEDGHDSLAVNVKRYGHGVGIANWMRAIPALVAQGRIPMTDGTHEGVKVTALNGLHDLKQARYGMSDRHAPLDPAVISVLRVGWRARATLQRARDMPARVGDGALEESPFMRRARLVWLTVRGTY